MQILPPPHQNDIEEGEIVIGFKAGEEKLFIKNSNNEIVEFEPTNNIIPNFYKSEIFDLVYPIGSIYINVNDVNPSVVFGIGKWEKIKDKFLLSAGDTYTNGKTGGSATVTLTETQVPNVSGQITMHGGEVSTNILGVDGCFSPEIINKKYKTGGEEVNASQSIGKIIFDNGGQGKSHNNMPPYLVVSIWKRIS